MTLHCVVLSIRNPAHSPVYSVNSPSKRSLDFLQTYFTPIILHVPRNVLSTKTHATWAIHQSDRNQFENKHGVCTLISTIIYVNGCVVLLNILITSIIVKICIYVWSKSCELLFSSVVLSLCLSTSSFSANFLYFPAHETASKFYWLCLKVHVLFCK